MKSEIIVELNVHYFLSEEGVHQMNAKTFNECQKQLILALEAYSSNSTEVQVDVIARGEGGVIDGFIIKFLSDVAYDLFKDKIKGFIQKIIKRFFANDLQNKRMSDAEVAQIWAEYKPLLEQGIMTKEEVEIIAKGNDNLVQLVSNYYKKILGEQTIVAINASANVENQPIISQTIEKKHFPLKIVEDISHQETETITATDIQIVSPVLQTKHGENWRGMFNGISIEFKVEDKLFLSQVYNNEIKFGSFTIIRCNLAIVHIFNEDGIEDEKKRKFIVKEVLNWADDETLQYQDTKTYRRIKDNKRQLSFDFEGNNHN